MSPWSTCGATCFAHYVDWNELFFSATAPNGRHGGALRMWRYKNKGWVCFLNNGLLYVWFCFVCNPSWPDSYSCGTTKLNTHAQCFGVPICIGAYFVHEYNIIIINITFVLWIRVSVHLWIQRSCLLAIDMGQMDSSKIVFWRMMHGNHRNLNSLLKPGTMRDDIRWNRAQLL